MPQEKLTVDHILSLRDHIDKRFDKFTDTQSMKYDGLEKRVRFIETRFAAIITGATLVINAAGLYIQSIFKKG